MLDNLYVRVDQTLAFKVIAFIESQKADSVPDGGVIDTVGDTAIIASLAGTDLSKHKWEEDQTEVSLQSGHSFVRILQ